MHAAGHTQAIIWPNVVVIFKKYKEWLCGDTNFWSGRKCDETAYF